MSDLDSDLARRLERLSAAVPVRAGRLDEVHAGAVSARRQVRMRWLTPLVALLMLALVGAATNWGRSRDLVPNGPISATTRVGDFELTITSARARYLAGENIDIEGSLTYRGPGPAVRVGDSFGSGGEARLVHFGVEEPVPVDGGAITLSGGVSRLMCDSALMEPNTPYVRPFTKAFGTSLPIPPNWIREPLRLPAGTWHPYAQARVGIGGCDNLVDLRVSLEITVATGDEAPTTSPLPSVATTEEVQTPDPSVDTSKSATDIDGDFELVLASDKQVYAPNEPIHIEGRLTYRGTSSSVLIGYDALISFQIAEKVFGKIQVGDLSLLMCATSTLVRDEPLIAAMHKSGGYHGGSLTDDEQAWLRDPVLTLPVGTWHVSASASSPCLGQGAPYELGTELTIVVRDPVGASAPPSALGTGTPIHLATVGPNIDLCPTALSGGVLARNPRTGLGFWLGIGPVLDVVWPAGFTAWTEDGVAVLRNPAGTVVAREGDQVRSGGGGLTDGRWFSCSIAVVAPTGAP